MAARPTTRQTRTFKVSHESLSPAVESIDDHLAICRASDLDPPILESRGRGYAVP